MKCTKCGVWTDGEEIVMNFGLCESCFDMDCPCNEGRPEGCPLHEYPDVVLTR
jgi:hypothetical protein